MNTLLTCLHLSVFQGFHVGYVICLNHCFVLIYDGYSETSCTFSFQSQTSYIIIVPVFQCLSLKQKHNTIFFVQYNSKEYLYLLNLLCTVPLNGDYMSQRFLFLQNPTNVYGEAMVCDKGTDTIQQQQQPKSTSKLYLKILKINELS